MRKAYSIYGQNDILFFLQEKGVHLVFDRKAPGHGGAFGDGRFQAVSLRWVTEKVWPAWVASLPDPLRHKKRGPRGYREYPRYIPEIKDCENHTALLKGACTVQLACIILKAMEDAKGRGEAFTQFAGCGVFEAWYTAQGSNGRRGPHAINLILHEDRQHNAILTPFEPKDGITFHLLDAEWRSIFFVSGR